MEVNIELKSYPRESFNEQEWRDLWEKSPSSYVRDYFQKTKGDKFCDPSQQPDGEKIFLLTPRLRPLT